LSWRIEERRDSPWRLLTLSCIPRPKGVETNPAGKTQQAPREEFDDKISANAKEMFDRGRTIFRWDTFGSEAFWGGKLQLHRAILGQKLGGVGAGLTPNQALKAGLKADVARVPKLLVEVMREGSVTFDSPETTLELLRADAVVGVRGVFDKDKNLISVGITCALCHSTVDDSFMKGIGRRLDGWPNRDLDVGAIAGPSSSSSCLPTGAGRAVHRGSPALFGLRNTSSVAA
jgi:hypothetical protein